MRANDGCLFLTQCLQKMIQIRMQLNITMQLKEIYSYSPAAGAYHLQNPPIYSIHPSSHYLSFVTRRNEVVFYNRKTARTSILFASEHGIARLLFTQKYLIIIENSTPEVIVFSIKSEKLKKKITGHRTQVLSIAFSPHRSIFCTASHDVCIVWDEATLACIKVLKCSTSSYCSCHFTSNGQYLFTTFSDGNVFGWDLDTFALKQYALSIESHKLSSACNQLVAAYSPKKISMADFSQDPLVFRPLQNFWEGYIEQVDFINSLMLVKTTHGFYLCQIILEDKIHLQNKKELIDQIRSFQVAKYASEVIIISKDLTKIRTMKIQVGSLSQTVPLTNQLLNFGNQCMGGFSNQEGCSQNTMPKVTSYCFSNQNYKLEQLNDGLYHQKSVFSSEKMKTYIRKNFVFPDKYRPLAYKNVLQLPISKSNFLELERKGRHSCIKMLDHKYPLDNLALSEAMKDVISLLAHYSPIFAESELIPALVFPFVCIFGEDRFFCFEVLYRLFNNWMSFLFENFPLANSDLLQNIFEIFEAEDPALLNHLRSKQISFTKLTWGLLSTMFSVNLNRDSFLAVADILISHPDDPSIIVFILMAYLEYNRTKIFNFKSERDLDSFLDEEHTVNTSIFIRKAFELKQKQSKNLYYHFRNVNFNEKSYLSFDFYPKHAVKMFEGKRKLEEQQYDKYLDEKRYHDEISKQMAKMVTKIKREADKASIESEAVYLQNEKERQSLFAVPKASTVSRRKKLCGLMNKLIQMLKNRDGKKNHVKEFMPLLNQVAQSESYLQLDEIESKLMELMTKVEPHQFHLPLNSQPMTFGKQKAGEFISMKAAKRSQVANKLWETDKMGQEVQENRFEYDFEKAMKL